MRGAPAIAEAAATALAALRPAMSRESNALAPAELSRYGAALSVLAIPATPPIIAVSLPTNGPAPAKDQPRLLPPWSGPTLPVPELPPALPCATTGMQSPWWQLPTLQGVVSALGTATQVGEAPSLQTPGEHSWPAAEQSSMVPRH